MKWFKHFSNASNDEFIDELEALFGWEGYGRWWKLLEIIAANMGDSKNCSAEYSWTRWQSLLKGKRSKLEVFFSHCENRKKISVSGIFSEQNDSISGSFPKQTGNKPETNRKQTGNILKISCPKLLELRDEYSRKSGQTPDSTPDKVAQDTDYKPYSNITPTTTTSHNSAKEGRSFTKECYETVVSVFPNLMAKNQSPFLQWESVGYSIENVRAAIEQVRAQGITPESFAYFTPVIARMLSPPQRKEKELEPVEEVYKRMKAKGMLQ